MNINHSVISNIDLDKCGSSPRNFENQPRQKHIT